MRVGAFPGGLEFVEKLQKVFDEVLAEGRLRHAGGFADGELQCFVGIEIPLSRKPLLFFEFVNHPLLPLRWPIKCEPAVLALAERRRTGRALPVMASRKITPLPSGAQIRTTGGGRWMTRWALFAHGC